MNAGTPEANLKRRPETDDNNVRRGFRCNGFIVEVERASAPARGRRLRDAHHAAFQVDAQPDHLQCIPTSVAVPS